jgi:hypothetical protein
MTSSPSLLKLLSGINEHISRCEQDRITGELCIRIPFSQGGIGQIRIERKENVIIDKKI